MIISTVLMVFFIWWPNSSTRGGCALPARKGSTGLGVGAAALAQQRDCWETARRSGAQPHQDSTGGIQGMLPPRTWPLFPMVGRKRRISKCLFWDFWTEVFSFLRSSSDSILKSCSTSDMSWPIEKEGQHFGCLGWAIFVCSKTN